MLTYTFSRREKALITLFTLLLMVVGWYQLVYVNATDQIQHLEAEIQSLEFEIKNSQTKIAKMQEMQRVIEQRYAEGAKTTPIPDYDNIKPLMAELDTIMAQVTSYTLQFEALDTESSEYIHRGVTMHFACGSYEQAEAAVLDIVEGDFPCFVDAIEMGTAPMSTAEDEKTNIRVTLHVIFYERP